VPGVTSVDRSIPGAAGDLEARVFTPSGSGPFTVIVYYHGGG
jgi:acetyl esterase